MNGGGGGSGGGGGGGGWGGCIYVTLLWPLNAVEAVFLHPCLKIG